MEAAVNNKIFYFSGTGNTKYTAERIANSFDAVGGADLLKISDAVASADGCMMDFSAGDSLVVVSPIYFWGLPSIVADFLGKLQIAGYQPQQNFISIVFTCGGSTGLADKMAAKILRAGGYTLNAAFSVRMPDNYCIKFDFMTPVNEIEPILLQAEEKITSISAAIIDNVKSCIDGVALNSLTGIQTRYKGENLLHRGFNAWMATTFAYPLYRSDRKTKPFIVSDVCIECGICAKICPVGIISLQSRDIGYTDKKLLRPVWKEGQCVQCLACLHHCPVRAIQYGSKTQKCGRYLNPKTDI